MEFFFLSYVKFVVVQYPVSKVFNVIPVYAPVKVPVCTPTLCNLSQHREDSQSSINTKHLKQWLPPFYCTVNKATIIVKSVNRLSIKHFLWGSEVKEAGLCKVIDQDIYTQTNDSTARILDLLRRVAPPAGNQ